MVTNSRDATIAATFEEQVLATPDAVAVGSAGGELSYRDLNGRANRLAHHLSGRGVTRGQRVGVQLHDPFNTVIAQIAVLKAGGVCVPLDSRWPLSRLDFVLRDTETALVLTERGLKDELSDIAPATLWLEENDSQFDGYPDDNPGPVATGTDLGYIFYTSGSTGDPKGVEMEHHALCQNFHGVVNILRLTSRDAMFQSSSITFVSSIGQIFGPLFCGARIVMRDQLDRLTDYLREKGVTVLWLTTSVLREFMTMDGFTGPHAPPLRIVELGGEPLELPLVKEWFAHTTVPLVNVYGPTEAVQDVTASYLTEPPSQVTIGRPVGDNRVFVVAGDELVTTPGTAGELLVWSQGLARGFVNDPALTSERFVWREIDGSRLRLLRTGDLVRWLPDGQLEFVGRLDDQVKIRGYRIEPREIERRLEAHDAVVAAALVPWSDLDGMSAYYVGRADVSADELRAWCTTELPTYMIPDRFVRVEKLPLTVSGKIDRRALAASEDPGSSRY